MAVLNVCIINPNLNPDLKLNLSINLNNTSSTRRNTLTTTQNWKAIVGYIFWSIKILIRLLKVRIEGAGQRFIEQIK